MDKEHDLLHRGDCAHAAQRNVAFLKSRDSSQLTRQQLTWTTGSSSNTSLTMMPGHHGG